MTTIDKNGNRIASNNVVIWTGYLPSINKQYAIALYCLVDDIVDSRWILTVIAALLQQKGSAVVYLAALADSSEDL